VARSTSSSSYSSQRSSTAARALATRAYWRAVSRWRLAERLAAGGLESDDRLVVVVVHFGQGGELRPAQLPHGLKKRR
jgi:hypothetical protein